MLENEENSYQKQKKRIERINRKIVNRVRNKKETIKKLNTEDKTELWNSVINNLDRDV